MNPAAGRRETRALLFHVRPHFCSMKITQDVREYAAQKEIDEQVALQAGMKEKLTNSSQLGQRFTKDSSTGLTEFTG